MTVLAPVLVDTAALAEHLRCSPSYVRLLVSEGIITPLGRRSLHWTGRPSMWFDVDAVNTAMAAAVQSGRVRLDRGLRIVRKS
ncbi:MAG TPA: hypothetical protein VFY84_04865 [Jiangellales bacterium]|nr:hypothetical protein [Jiangellales bacterium]